MRTKRPRLLTGLAALFAMTGAAVPLHAQSWANLESGFRQPPASSRPKTLLFWMNGNVTRDGLTRDLEALKRVGIGGVFIFDGGTYLPKGPVDYLSPAWRELMTHAITEADRLGLDVGMHNGPGWSSSGGPWITPERSMQKMVWTETQVSGPQRVEMTLRRPEANEGYYRDAFVLSFPSPPRAGKPIEDWTYKANFAYRVGRQLTLPVESGGESAIDPARVLDLTAQMDGQGRLTWSVPAGSWTILRIGHTSTGKRNVSASQAGEGLECDKMSREATEFHFRNVIAKVIADVGTLAGKTFTGVEIDSYEAGMQNWTAAFPEEFRRRNGYDLRRYLPAMTGRMVASVGISERFLFDVRRTQAHLMAEYYYGRMAELCRAHGLTFYVEPYGQGVFDELQVGGLPDVPMSEFWERTPWTPNRVMNMVASAAHIYGKPVVAGESFTGEEQTARWLEYPYSLKTLGDLMFSRGLNQMIFHRYAHQPHPSAAPGMTMGPWGFPFDRSNTWFDQSSAWLEYLARCQYLLRQGTYVADVLYFVGERPPEVAQYEMPVMPAGYNYDLVNAEVLLRRAKVRDGRIVMPDGAGYRLLMLLDDLQAMTPELLRRLRDLVSEGMILLGPKVEFSPTLRGYPASDAEVRRIAGELWGSDANTRQGHALGKGRVFSGRPLAEILSLGGGRPDFEFTSRKPDGTLSWLHRKLPDGDLYFVANRQRRSEDVVCTFRVGGRQPEFWRPETGVIDNPAIFAMADGRVRVPMHLDPAESVFVVFRSPVTVRPAQWLSKDGVQVIQTEPHPGVPGVSAGKIENTFTIAVWAKPDIDLRLMPRESGTGRIDETGKNYVVPAPEGDTLYGRGHAAAGIAAGRNGVYVVERSSESSPAVLVANMPLSGWTHLAVVYRAGKPRLYVDGKFVREGLVSGSIVHSGVGAPPPAPGVVYHFKALDDLVHASGRPSPPSRGLVYYFEGYMTEPEVFDTAFGDDEIRELASRKLPLPQDTPDVELSLRPDGKAEALIWHSGTYALDDGVSIKAEVAKPAELTGPWRVAFPAGLGAPPTVTLPELMSLHRHPDPGVKYFSGTATYAHPLEVPAESLGGGKRLYLDLGRVEVIASLRVNGKDLGILWKEPYRADVTDAVHAGANQLEIRVTTLWPNRMIGDEQLPPENQYGIQERGILRLPDWYAGGKPKPPGGRITFSTWKFYSKDDPLLESGLLGPVRLLNPVRRVLER